MMERLYFLYYRLLYLWRSRGWESREHEFIEHFSSSVVRGETEVSLLSNEGGVIPGKEQWIWSLGMGFDSQLST